MQDYDYTKYADSLFQKLEKFIPTSEQITVKQVIINAFDEAMRDISGETNTKLDTGVLSVNNITESVVE